MTNLISLHETSGHHLVYLPKYTAPDDPLFQCSEEELWTRFHQALQRVVPDLTDGDIEARFLFRERFVQPLPVLHYPDLVPPMITNIPGVLLANTTHIVHSTLNNNAMVHIARRAVDLLETQSIELKPEHTGSIATSSV
jgi:protoporphyrinogen oxidase